MQQPDSLCSFYLFVAYPFYIILFFFKILNFIIYELFIFMTIYTNFLFILSLYTISLNIL